MNFVQPIRSRAKINAIIGWLRERSERNAMLFIVGIHTGLRISDILKLRAGDVRGTHVVLNETKTRKRKWTRVTPDLRRELRAYTADMADDEYLFPSRQGGPISRSMAYKILREAAEAHGLVDIGTHTLRKTFGYHVYLATKDVVVLQQLFNHSSPAITLRYIGYTQDVMDKALSRLSYSDEVVA